MTNISKNLLLLLLTIILVFNGCAGRQPKPISIVQNGDEKKSCIEIDSELKTISGEIWERYPEIKDTKSYNLGVGLVGSLFHHWSHLQYFQISERKDLRIGTKSTSVFLYYVYSLNP